MNSPTNPNDGRPPFDDVFARDLVGKRVLVGMTRLDAKGELIEQIQYHGEIVVVDALKGFCLKLQGLREGEHEWLPPDTRAFQKAPPGEYRLYSTGEIVADPDYTACWTSRKERDPNGA